MPQPTQTLCDIGSHRTPCTCSLLVRSHGVASTDRQRDHCREEETRRVDRERGGEGNAEQQPPERRTDQPVGDQFDRLHLAAGTLEIVSVDERWHDRHRRTVNNRLGGRQQRRHDVEQRDRDVTRGDHRHEDKRHDRSCQIETDPHPQSVEAISKCTARKNEQQPWNPVGDRHTGNQPGIARQARRQQRQCSQANPVPEIGDPRRQSQPTKTRRQTHRSKIRPRAHRNHRSPTPRHVAACQYEGRRAHRTGGTGQCSCRRKVGVGSQAFRLLGSRGHHSVVGRSLLTIDTLYGATSTRSDSRRARA